MSLYYYTNNKIARSTIDYKMVAVLITILTYMSKENKKNTHLISVDDRYYLQLSEYDCSHIYYTNNKMVRAHICYKMVAVIIAFLMHISKEGWNILRALILISFYK